MNPKITLKEFDHRTLDLVRSWAHATLRSGSPRGQRWPRLAHRLVVNKKICEGKPTLYEFDTLVGVDLSRSTKPREMSLPEEVGFIIRKAMSEDDRQLLIAFTLGGCKTWKCLAQCIEWPGSSSHLRKTVLVLLLTVQVELYRRGILEP